ncbi:hypothetical protein CEP14_09460 [Cylindrospermopsis raciborskii C04]|uniref:Uncharacterized protein n=1 Tax=Cylindrospermopsis raciborskii C07 TaxID=2014886 RepID=A0ABX4WMT2_9CYAN|nr:hypothetical protein CEP14_09460 [Cylindrospermopsis raciborskii C04]PNJ96796.1 hypothetical protein CEP13_05120 [Cylindrospermopsis raciborskii C03]PNJ98882.1 hypothetical protein CEP15_07885 [Cylindrospermopsis raciborskii C07]
MNGIVDPNIQYWWLKKDLICGHRFPRLKYIIVKSSSQPPQWKIFWCVIHRVRGILGGLGNAIAFMNGIVYPNIKY